MIYRCRYHLVYLYIYRNKIHECIQVYKCTHIYIYISFSFPPSAKLKTNCGDNSSAIVAGLHALLQVGCPQLEIGLQPPLTSIKFSNRYILIRWCSEIEVPLNHPFLDGISIMNHPFGGTHCWKPPYVMMSTMYAS